MVNNVVFLASSLMTTEILSKLEIQESVPVMYRAESWAATTRALS